LIRAKNFALPCLQGRAGQGFKKNFRPALPGRAGQGIRAAGQPCPVTVSVSHSVEVNG